MWWATLLGSLVTAIVGLIGVTAGARLSARETRRATDRVDERSATADARSWLVARRLVDDELHRAASVLLSQEQEAALAGLAMSLPLLDLASWREHRGTIAASLDRDGWNAVRAACTGIEIQAGNLAGLVEVGDHRAPLDPSWFRAFELVVERVDAARSYLAE